MANPRAIRNQAIGTALQEIMAGLADECIPIFRQPKAHALPKQKPFWLCLCMSVVVLAPQLAVSNALCESKNISCDNLPREKKYEYQMAVCLPSSQVLICKHNPAKAPHLITVKDPPSRLDFRWAVPASDSSQVVYVSTSYTEDQQLSVFRNGYFKNAKYVPRAFRTIHEFLTSGSTSKNPQESFQDYHLGSGTIDDNVREILASWHEKLLWQEDTYIYVKKALLVKPRPVLAAERLIRVRSDRPLASWIEFTSNIEGGSMLRMTLSYSGEAIDYVVPRSFHYQVNVVTPSAAKEPIQ